MRVALAALALTVLAACGGGGGTPADGSADPAAPAEGTEFVALGSSARTVSLGWTPQAGATAYTVERKNAAGVYEPVATLDASAGQFIDDGLVRNTSYGYRVLAVDAEGEAAIIGEQTATTGEDEAVVTPAGLPVGGAVQQAVGAAGARLVLGTAALDVPAGALPGDTAMSLQRITNTAPDGLGEGLRIRLDAAPVAPLALTLGYDAAMDDNADALGVAVQRGDGSWLSLPVLQIDKTARTLSVRLPVEAAAAGLRQPQRARAAAAVSLQYHVVQYLGFRLVPKQATVEVGRTQLLVPHARTRAVIGHVCVPVDDPIGCLPMPIVDTFEVPFANDKDGFTRSWYVWAEEGGDAVSGTVVPRAGAAGAIYTAPQQVPDPKTVPVTFRSVNKKTGRSVTLASNITIVEPRWTGIFRGTLTAPGGDIGFSITGQATWRPDAQVAGGGTYRAEGTQTLSVLEFTCTATVSPSSTTLPPGALVIDRSTTPATYTLDVGAIWNSTVTGTCPGQGSASVGMVVPGRLQASGTVGADGSINGTATLGGVAWDWAMTSAL